MRKETITYTVYNYDELTESAQEKVIDDYMEFIYDSYAEEGETDIPCINNSFKKAKKLQTPWFIREILWENCKEFIEEEVRKSEYFYNGKIA